MKTQHVLEVSVVYKPLEILESEVVGVSWALSAVRLPFKQKKVYTTQEDINLLSKLILSGDDHAKAVRGVQCYFKMECQVGWLIEYLTYRVGVEGLSSSSAMHYELKALSGTDLAKYKQITLTEKVYTRVEMVSYQALRHMYLARRNHRHPDWQVFCDWVETLPYFDKLINPKRKVSDECKGEAV